MSRRQALQAARKLGCVVEPVRRNGEVQIKHPGTGRIVRINNRRKSAPRQLTSMLRQIEEACHG